MAVLRAKRLWAIAISAGMLGGARPGVEPSDQERAMLPVYEVPQGKRAIVRSMTFALQDVPGSGNHQCSVWVQPPGVGYPGYKAFWSWFQFSQYQDASRTSFDWWNGQLVLHAGDIVHISNYSSMVLHTVGSGHELDALT